MAGYVGFGGKEVTQFLGRNGYFKCKGFEFRRIVTTDEGWSKDVVRVYPVTSKGRLARCFIEIPVNQIRRFMGILNRVAKG